MSINFPNDPATNPGNGGSWTDPDGNVWIVEIVAGEAIWTQQEAEVSEEPVIEWTLTANGSTDYIFSGTGFAGTETDPVVYVVRGQTYKFTNGMGAHPFQIQSTPGTSGTAYNDGITNNAVSNGTLTWEVRMDAPSTLYYQCTSHADMNGTIYVLDEGSSVASIDDLGDVDTSTAAPTDGQALVWDAANNQWEPGTVSGGGGTSLPSGSSDGEALIWENGAWAVGPVIGGVDYTPSGDADFSSVELLLLGNGTNGSQTITDSSSNSRTATVADNTQISTTQSKFGGSSIYFDGQGDYLEFAADAALLDWYSTGGFTVEAWVYADSWSGWEISMPSGNAPVMVGNSNTTTNTSFWSFGPDNSGNVTFQYYSSARYSVTSSAALSTGAWHHIAATYDGTTIRVFVDGTLDGSAAVTGTPNSDLNYNLLIGTVNGTYITGYIDDLRITQGVARYTATFTPPTAELPTTGTGPVTIPYSIDKLEDVDTSTVAPTDGQALLWDNTAQKWEPGTVSGGGGTSLPAAQDGEALIYENGQWVAGPVIGGVDYFTGSGDQYINDVELLAVFNGTDGSQTFTDSSSVGHTLTANGGTSVLKISTTQSKFGGSSGFFGNGYISLSSRIEFQSDPFTVEAWIYPTVAQLGSVFSNRDSGNGMELIHVSDGTIMFHHGNIQNSIITTTAVSLNTWSHIAVTRDSNDLFTVWINGVDSGSSTFAGVNLGAGRANPAIGRRADSAAQYYNGYIDDLRVTNGVCRYTANFTAPTAEFSTQLPTQTTIPYSIDKLDDVDTSTVAPTDGQALLWDAANSKWEPGTVSTSSSGGGGGGGGITTSTAWAPSDLTLTMWLDADDASTITETSGAVSVWGDKTSNAFNVAQATAANQPTLTANGLNGKSVITFDGSNDYISVPADLGSQPLTIVCVVKANSTSTVGGRSFVFDGLAANERCMFALAGDNNNYPQIWNNTQWLGPSSNSFDTDPHIYVLTFDGSNSAIKVDGGSAFTGTVGTDGLGSGIVLGSRMDATSDWLNGAIAEFIVLPTVGIDDQEKLEGYLAHKWGLAASLPAAHTYKSAAPVNTETTSLPSGTADGEALIWENGAWAVGPVIGGVNYTASGDADFSSVELLLLGNGTNGSTTITDSSNNALTITANGNSQISTTQSKFGGASIYFDGTGDYLSSPNQSWMSFGTNPFTIETWFYINANSGTVGNGTRGATIVANYPSSGTTSNGWLLHLLGDSSTTGTGLEFYGRDSSGNIVHQVTYSGTISQSTWHHVAVVRETTAVKLYLDGTEVASTTLTASDSFAGVHPLLVATNSYSNWEAYLNGYIDDLRITSGVARYTANFTPPTAELSTTAGTPVTIPYSIDKLEDVDTSTVAPTDGQALLWDNTASKWEPGSIAAGTSIENARTETFTYEVTTVSGSTTEPTSPGAITVRTGGTLLWRVYEQDKAGKDLLLTSEYSSPTTITMKRNGTDETYTIQTYGLIKQGNYFQFGTAGGNYALGDTFEFTFTRPAEGDYAALKADLTSYETVSGDVVRGIKPNDKLLTAASTVGHVYDSFQAGSPGSPTADGQYAIRTTSTPIIRVWPNDTNGNAMDLHTVSYTGATGTNQKPFFYAWADGVLYKIPISSQIYSQSGYYQWYCTGGATELGILQNAGSFRLVLPWEAYEEPQDGDVLTYDSANKTYHPKTANNVAAINDLSDVDTSTVAPTDGQALLWDAANSQWEPGTVSTSTSSSSSSGGGVTTSTDWSPSDLTLSMWLDADDASTITESGGAVSAWNDKTANAFNVAQATAANQPTLTANGLNGKSVITFDGTNDYLSVAPSIQTQPMTIAVVCKANSTAVSGGVAGRAYVFDGMGTSSTGRTILALDGDSNGHPQMYAGAWVGDSTSTFDTDAHIFVLTFDGSNSSLKFDGGTAVSGNAGSQSLTNGITLGANYQGLYDFFDGAIAEFIVLPLVGSLDQQKLEGYLAHKWGLEASLPAAHPYKAEAPVNVETTALPSGTADGEALIWQDGAWNIGPVIGGVDYATSGDADYSNVSVLLLGNGSDGSTTFTDSSSSPFTFTGNGAAEISTTQSKFGGASISLPSSTASYLSTPSDSSLSLDGDFTIEAWVYNTGGGTYRPIIGSNKTSWGGGAFAVDIYTGGANPVLTLQQHSGAATLTGTTALSLNTWHHVAVTRIGSTVRLFVDGVQDGSVSTTGTYDFGNNGTFYVGKHGWGSDEYHGYIDDLRITKGVARYTADFTPPTAELESTAAGQITIPYSIDKLDDVDTSTVAPTDGQALLWDNTAQKWEPGTVSGGGTSLPAAQDGEALIYENGQWVAGPVIGGVDYSIPNATVSDYTVPTGFTAWNDVFVLLDSNAGTLSNNDRTATTTTPITQAYSSTTKSTGKWYWEIQIDNGLDSSTTLGIGTSTNNWVGSTESGGLGIFPNGSISNHTGGSAISSVASHAAGDVRMFALDADAKKLWIGKNGTWDNSGNPAAGTGEVASGWPDGKDWMFIVRLHSTGNGFTIKNYISTVSTTIPYSIDKLDDVDTSTVAPTDGQALIWDNAAGKWEPGTVSGGGGSGISRAQATAITLVFN